MLRKNKFKVPKEIRVRLFKHGGSQAVRLTKELRLDGTEALAHREGELVILRPIAKRAWPEGYWATFGPVDYL